MQNITLAEFLRTVRENESLLRGYSSKKCNDCYGRGYIELKRPKENPELYMCHCVEKKIKKEFSQRDESN